MGFASFTPCKGIIQHILGFWIPRCGFWILGTGFQYLSVELGFWTAIVSGIPDPLNCIPDSKTQDSEFHKQNFPKNTSAKDMIGSSTRSYIWLSILAFLQLFKSPRISPLANVNQISLLVRIFGRRVS